MNDALRSYLDARSREPINELRRSALVQLADAVREGAPRLLFVCTHNSRRSHFGQLWALAAARRFDFDHVQTFSGGTESTAFHPHAIGAIERAGWEIVTRSPGVNPRIELSTGDEVQSVWSKRFDDAENPHEDFVAVLTCSQADADCPVIAGASLRIALPYEDPKQSDGSGEEARVYDERCAEIAREMLWVFSEARRT
jgi:protein-tyrosine-phosphatase